MVPSPSRNLETRLRLRARRKGLVIKKSRRRKPDSPGFGGYMLFDVDTNSVLVGNDGFAYSATLEEIERYLKTDKRPRD
jgi:hypothetical protein